MKSNGGEIVQVEGGHILRSTGRKDRHSKVYTAKGPRYRRVRLAAHTAIQFYDVQDRLGYDRPSKAVDWLINKAKNAIDKLEELPPWNPMDTTTELNPCQNPNGLSFQQQQQQSEPYPFHEQLGDDPIDNSMRSFFLTSSGMKYHNYPSVSVQNNPQDLCLSLHSLQDLNNSGHPTPAHDHPSLYSGPSEAYFPRMVGWDGEIKAAEGYSFCSHTMTQAQMICQNTTTFTQREPLQSSFSPYVRAWNDLPLPASDHTNTQAIHHFSISSSSQFGSDKFSGYQVPARIHGEDPSSQSDKNHN